MSLRRFVPLICLSAVTFAIWCTVMDRWTFEAWRTPAQLYGDPLEIYARIQIASEDLSQPLTGYADLPRLAAPLGADWRQYPISDRVVFTLLGALARVAGLFVAVNLAMAAGHVLNAVAFYLCARFLRWRREWAFATALLFSFASYNFRWSATVSLSLTFAIPPLLLLCGWIARSAPAVRARAWTWAAVALGAWFGGGNPYLGFFAGQLVGWSIILQLLRRREIARWRTGLVYIGVLGVSFLLHNAPYFLAPPDGASGSALDRNYAGSEVYALKLTDLVVPPAEHHLVGLANIGHNYSTQSALPTEFFVNYLGLAGITGLAILLWTGLRALAKGRGGRVPDAALGVVWALVFSMPGGINSLIALAGFDTFRASNRNSVFVLVWALWFFGRWCQRWQPRVPVMRIALPLVVAAVGVIDSLPRLPSAAGRRTIAAELRAHSSLTSTLEQNLGRDARIFQVPSPPFPEAGTIVEMPDYEHFLPFLSSEALRFSYGALKGSALSRHYEAVARAPAPLMKSTLEATGFDAIWIDRRGLADDGGKLLDSFRSLDLTEIPQTAVPHVTIFRLKPAASPQPPDALDPRFLPPWDEDNDDDGDETKRILAVLEGWDGIERDSSRNWRWAADEAATSLALPEPGTVELSFVAYSLGRGELVLELDGADVWRRTISSKSREQHTLRLKLEERSRRLVWRFSGPLKRPTNGDPRKLGFAIENLRAVELPGQ